MALFSLYGSFSPMVPVTIFVKVQQGRDLLGRGHE